MAAGNRQWSTCCVAGNSLVCSSIASYSASAKTDTGSSPWTVHLMETYDDPENGYYMYYMYYHDMYYMYFMYYLHYVYKTNCFVLAGWLKSIGYQILYELDHRKPVLYVAPVDYIMGKLPLVPVGDTERFSTTCTACFKEHLATAGRVLSVDAVCGLSTHHDGQWRGPVTCNEWEGEFDQYQASYTTLMCCFVPTFIMTFMAIIAIMYLKLISLIVHQIKQFV
jgi:hypothetical protein